MDRTRINEDLEKVDQAHLESALTVQGESSQALLSDADSSRLLAMMDDLTRRYPSQDQEASIEPYFRDFERLAAKYSLRKVEKAIEALRIMPGRNFFPRPDEVAEEIENQRERNNARAMYNSGFDKYWEGVKAKYNSPEERAWRISQGYETPKDAA